MTTRNETLKTWIPGKASLDDLLNASDADLVRSSQGYGIRVAYQRPVSVKWSLIPDEALANTFEDALLYANLPVFKNIEEGNGLLGKFVEAVASSKNLGDLAKKLEKALESGSKAELALELLLRDDLKAPQYIHEGLAWLLDRLQQQSGGAS